MFSHPVANIVLKIADICSYKKYLSPVLMTLEKIDKTHNPYICVLTTNCYNLFEARRT